MEHRSEDTGHVSHKPERRTFVTYGLLKSAVGSLVLLALVFLGLQSFPHAPKLTILGGLFALLVLQMLWTWIILPIQYNKEFYEIRGDRLLAKGGSIFSSYEQELLVKNVTHITIELPFIEHKLFQTGSIHIQAAGGDGVEIYMRNIAKPRAMYKQLLKLLENNGFSVSCNAIVEADSPDATGVWLSTFGTAIASAIFPLWLTGAAYGAINDPKIAGNIILGPSFWFLMALLVASGIAGIIFFHGRNMRRQYHMYEDAITSKTNFFGVKESIIPMKNLSDSALNQGVIGRLLGIHHVTLSCQGSGHEIVFQHVPNGERWKQSLDGLLKAQAVQRAANKEAAREEANQTPGFQPKPSWEGTAERDETFTAEFKMDKRYLFIPVFVTLGAAILFGGVGFALGVAELAQLPRGEKPPITVIIGMISMGIGGLALILTFLRAVGGIIMYQANTFYVRPTGFEQDFQFIFKRKVVFNAEKVTGVIIKRGIFDRIIGTCSIEFWSIGASDHIRFRHIREDEELLTKIKAKVALHPKEDVHPILTKASFADILKANIFFYVFLVLLAPVLLSISPYALIGLAVVFAAPLAFAHIYYQFHFLELYDDALWFRKGIFWRTEFYIRYEDIKYITSTQYPLTTTGTLTFDVAGERIIKTDNGEHKISNRFHVHYVPELPRCHQSVDMLFSQQASFDTLAEIEQDLDAHKPKVLQTTKPHMLQMLFLRGIGLLVLDTLLIGGAAYMLVGGGLSLNEINKLQEIPAMAFALTWGLPLLIGINVVAFLLLTLYVRSISYVIDGEKVIKRWGLFFKKNLGIHFADIDYIGKQQGAINKIFSTTNITVNTVGSSATDMTLSAMPDANRFYKTLKEHYRPADS